jgi:hypothetical protein
VARRPWAQKAAAPSRGRPRATVLAWATTASTRKSWMRRHDFGAARARELLGLHTGIECGGSNRKEGNRTRADTGFITCCSGKELCAGILRLIIGIIGTKPQDLRSLETAQGSAASDLVVTRFGPPLTDDPINTPPFGLPLTDDLISAPPLGSDAVLTEGARAGGVLAYVWTTARDQGHNQTHPLGRVK